MTLGIAEIFYYDDFLGRTALTERLGNEEDRLLGFMKRAAASRTTLFVLTTREYILQQASELYEQLANEGVEGRHFLLELAQYSRTDRARIFYNHASFSDGLSRRARRALLAGRAYEKIIDHPAYNPRHIEWITGLSGHHLTAEDNADYVAFAIDALSHPGEDLATRLRAPAQLPPARTAPGARDDARSRRARRPRARLRSIRRRCRYQHP